MFMLGGLEIIPRNTEAHGYLLENDTGWLQQAILQGTNGLPLNSIIDQGFSVALSADGNTALIGAYADNNSRGAAWIFTRSDTTWSQQGPKITPVDTIGPYEPAFGYSVSISADGNVAMIGGNDDDSIVGSLWAYMRTDTTWVFKTKLRGTGYLGLAQQGYAVSLSADGSTAFDGAPQDGNPLTGAAWVFIAAPQPQGQLNSKRAVLRQWHRAINFYGYGRHRAFYGGV